MIQQKVKNMSFFCLSSAYICIYILNKIVLTQSLCMHVCVVAQLCLSLCSPVDCSPAGSSVHGIFQARILWVAITMYLMMYTPENLVLNQVFVVFHILDVFHYKHCLNFYFYSFGFFFKFSVFKKHFDIYLKILTFLKP